MAIRFLAFLVLLAAIPSAFGNLEGDVLSAWRSELVDPFNVLQSWDPTLVNPCTWFHVSCNNNNSVTRVDLGRAGLSGRLIPQLALLPNLQYLEVFGNNLTGSIPKELGNLKKLISLDLYENRLSGRIPASLGGLRSLGYLRLNSNKLIGEIPQEVLNLVRHRNLRIMNVSDNLLAGTIHSTNSRGFAVTTIIQDVKAKQ